jgi:hypothetical protein
MPVLLSSLIAVFLVIALGWGARRSGFLPDEAWRGFEAVTYHLLFPAVIIHTLAFARFGEQPFVAVGGALLIGLTGLFALLFALRPWFERQGVDGPAFSSVFQGAARWNTFVALALASHLFGAQGVALMAVAIAAMIPVLNIACVLVLTRYARREAFDLKDTALTLIRNPFIWSCLAGLLLNPVAGLVPQPVSNAVDIVGRAALAAGLLVVGAGLDLKRLAAPRLPHLAAIMLKLIVMPLIVMAAGRALGAEGAAFTVAMIAATVPTASASYILARQMGGDAPLMAEIATLQTMAAMLTMPAILIAFAM